VLITIAVVSVFDMHTCRW